ncbi:MAG: hypothetical protein ACRDWI_07490 [Jiangellaceae bacterium]
MKLLSRSRTRAQRRVPAVEFCESCSQVCTGADRADAALDRAKTRAALYLLH